MIETVKAMDELRKAAKMALNEEMSGETLAAYAMMAVKQFFSDYSTLVEAERVIDLRGELGHPVYGGVKYYAGEHKGNVINFVSLDPSDVQNWRGLPKDPGIQVLNQTEHGYRKLSEVDALAFGDGDSEIVFKQQHFKDIHKPGLFSRFFTKEEA